VSFPCVAVAEVPGILFRHGEAIGEIQASKDVALGTQAAWTPTHDTLLFATNGKIKKLIVRSWRDGEQQDQVLPLPVVKTELELQWQWSFSPDGRWLAVQRWVHPRHFAPHGGTEPIREEAEKVKWLGVVDLKTLQAQSWKPWGAILGWRNGTCLLFEENYRTILAVDPAWPERAEKMVENSGALAGLSPDGRWAVIFDGREGNVKVTLQELGGKPLRILLEDPLSRSRSYSRGGSANGAFSPKSELVAITTMLYEGSGWKTSVSLESLDGQKRLYEDSFDIDGTIDKALAVWSPARSEQFVYFRFRRGQENGELVVVDVEAGKATAEPIALNARPKELRKFPLVWSPSGDQAAWLVAGRRVVICDMKTKATSIGSCLPDDATSWSWASPRVGGISMRR